MTKPKPFKAIFRPRGGEARGLIEGDCPTHSEDHVRLLDQVMNEMR